MTGRYLHFADWFIEEWDGEDGRTHCGVPVPSGRASDEEWKAFHIEVESRLDRERLVQHDYD